MTEQDNTQICGKDETRYATREEFIKILDEDMNGLYQLSFLLTGDHQTAERCFVAGIEDCVGLIVPALSWRYSSLNEYPAQLKAHSNRR